ncbi:DUF3703 domain-containing protein [Dokdonella sp. MW10]|uniref:DUF3703 domain-containing protein n=1 Tax=Dokdonella sp. MW10 TaxID=2992926 RepID=UPI003F7D7C4E
MRWKTGQRERWEAELVAAGEAEAGGSPDVAFAHLERAHILGQRKVFAHTLVHWRMFVHGLRRRDLREVLGQLPRMLAALTKTLVWVPKGNTGGARVSAFRPMPVPADLRRFVE